MLIHLTQVQTYYKGHIFYSPEKRMNHVASKQVILPSLFPLSLSLDLSSFLVSSRLSCTPFLFLKPLLFLVLSLFLLSSLMVFTFFRFYSVFRLAFLDS